MNFEQLKKKIDFLFTSSKIVENFPDMIIYTDIEGNVKAANKKAADFFGISDNITINELLTDGMKLVKESVKYKKVVLANIKNRQNQYVELSASKSDDDYCISLRDNSKLIDETLEKEGIERFSNDKNAMLVKLENEIKSPLVSITGFAQGLVDGIGGEITEKQGKYLKIILNNANDMKEFTDKFLDFSYAESLLYEPENKTFDIVSEIKNILKNLESRLKLENTEYEFDYSSLDTRNITTDYKAFKKTVENILEVSLSLTKNGKIYLHLAYPDEETRLSCELEEDRKYFQLTVKDTGANIPPEEMQYICNPYTKTDKGRKIFVRSLKLGIASILAKRSEGIFAINSDSGQGNLYNIIIPDKKEENEQRNT